MTELRQALGLTLDELADKSGISRRTIWSMEQGTQISDAKKDSIADALRKEAKSRIAKIARLAF